MRVFIYHRHSFCFNDTATTEIYTLSLHDALPIWPVSVDLLGPGKLPPSIHLVIEAQEKRIAPRLRGLRPLANVGVIGDRKSTRLNSSHANISYAVFCLKKTTQGHMILDYITFS